MIVLGLTGGIGMGKSNAAGIFRRLRIPVFDADAAVRRLQAPAGAALPAIGRAFPGTVRDGVLDRARLREAALASDAARRRLEAILHPAVRREQAKFLARARGAGARLVVLDVPLLFETGGDRRVDVVVVVSAPRDVQLARVRARGTLNAAQIAAMLAAQMPDSAKRARADAVVLTGLSRQQTQRQVIRIVKDSSFLKKRNKKLSFMGRA